MPFSSILISTITCLAALVLLTAGCVNAISALINLAILALSLASASARLGASSASCAFSSLISWANLLPLLLVFLSSDTPLFLFSSFRANSLMNLFEIAVLGWLPPVDQ